MNSRLTMSLTINLSSPAAMLLATTTLLLLGGCQKQAEPAAEAQAEPADAALTVTLTAEQITSLGVVIAPVAAATFTPGTPGYAQVVSHDSIAQWVAEVDTASSAATQSHAALQRVQALSQTPGAASIETQESVARQAAADAIALQLAQRRLSANLGTLPVADNARSALTADLASGRVKLIRATFPLGSVNSTPHQLTLTRLESNSGKESWPVTTVWNAPADASIPGRSFFGSLKTDALAEGDRLQVTAPVGGAEQGVFIPGSAVVMHDGEYWFYQQQAEDKFVRTPIDISKAQHDGYFLKADIKPGTMIVTAAAGLLLAQETNPGTEAE